ncbi:MAG: OsmC family protein [Ardenticatenaceae bacterium]|nr:OsmC family protein [Ardenticatenaceae bacterium]MCB9444759.1 OsmC family protein [Ardenticatenaceae bacterium]
MDATLKWHDGLKFTATANSNHEIILDSDPSVGGSDQGSRPMEMILEGLAGCTAMDVISIMRKKRQNVTGFQVTAHAERAEQHPKVFTAIEIKYTFWGKDIDPKAAERAIELSEQIYCPAQAMLAKIMPIKLSYEIIED